MIVCHCFRVTDREIRSCAREGASSVIDVGHACAAGTGCGGCRPEIANILDSERELSHGAFRRLPVLQETG